MSTKDQILSSALHGEALLAARRPELQPVIDHLREVAQGRDDTRVQCAGTIAAGGSRIPLDEVRNLIAAGLPMLAGRVDLLVNAIAPIMTEPGGDAWRQTTFFPLAVTSRLAVRSSLLVKLESDTYQIDLHGELPTVDAVATHDPKTGQSAIFGADLQRPRSPLDALTG